MNALLLDTHALLWSLGDVDRLSTAVSDVLAEGATPVYVSAASIWEIATKRRAGKLKAPANLAQEIAKGNFEELPISHRHAELAGDLPPHHRDPFDRMLVAQARCERLTIVTRDERIAAYDVPVLW